MGRQQGYDMRRMAFTLRVLRCSSTSAIRRMSRALGRALPLITWLRCETLTPISIASEDWLAPDSSHQDLNSRTTWLDGAALDRGSFNELPPTVTLPHSIP